MTKGIFLICAGMLAVGAGVWGFGDDPTSVKAAQAEVVRPWPMIQL